MALSSYFIGMRQVFQDPWILHIQHGLSVSLKNQMALTLSPCLILLQTFEVIGRASCRCVLRPLCLLVLLQHPHVHHLRLYHCTLLRVQVTEIDRVQNIDVRLKPYILPYSYSARTYIISASGLSYSLMYKF